MTSRLSGSNGPRCHDGGRDEKLTTDRTAGPKPGRRRLTVQGWLILVLALMGLVVLAGAIAAALLLVRADRVSHELSESIQPARVAAYQLQAALRDQETSLRGYVIATDRQFLDPYFDGMRTEADAADRIRQRVGDLPEQMADLDAIEQAAANWRADYAEPLIAAVGPGLPLVADSATADRPAKSNSTVSVRFSTLRTTI